MLLLGESHRLFSDILGALAGGLGLALERAHGAVGGGNETVEGLPGLLDALLGECPHFRRNLETLGEVMLILLLLRGLCFCVDCHVRRRRRGPL